MRESQSFLISYVKNHNVRSNTDITSYFQYRIDIVLLSQIYNRHVREGQSFLIIYVKNHDVKSNTDLTSYFSISFWYRTCITNKFHKCERRSIFPHKLRQKSWCKVKYWPYIIFFNLVLISYFYRKYTSDMWEKVNLFW